MELRLFGPVDLRDAEGNALHSVLSQTKRMAVLSYIGASGGWVRRAQVVGLFWPDLPETRARRALSQTLYHLRRRLGDEVLVSRGDHELGLDAAHIGCDVARFLSAVERKNDQAAADLYDGDFMDGFHLPGDRAFNEWMARTRDELRARAAWSCLRVASNADPGVDTVQVVRMSWRATKLAPFDETLQRAAAQLLLTTGDRGAAVRVCEGLVERLEHELQVDPHPKTLALLRALRAPLSPSEGAQGKPPTTAGTTMTRPEDSRALEASSPAAPTVREFEEASHERRATRTPAFSFGLAALGGGVMGALALWVFADPASPPVLRFEIPFSPEQAPATTEAIQAAGITAAGTSFTAGNRLALSADGSQLVYLHLEGNETRLWSRRLTEWEGRAIAGTMGASRGFLSPDGRALGFFTSPPPLELRRVSVSGGPPQLLADSVYDEAGGSWGTDGFIYFVGRSGDLRRVPEAGGAASSLLSPDDHPWATGFAHPDALPTGRGVLITVQAGLGPADAQDDSIAVFDRRTGEFRHLMAGIKAAFLDSGHVVAVTAAGTLVASSFDADRLRLRGPVVPVFEGIPVTGRYTDVGFSRSGLMVYETYPVPETRPVWVGRDGAVEPVDTGWAIGTDRIETLDLSPDEREVLLAVRSPGRMEEVWVKELGGPLRRLAFPRSAGRPAWSPTGDSLLFLSEPESGGTYDVWSRASDGTGTGETILDLEPSVAEARWGRDGDLIVRTAFRPSADIFRVVWEDTVPRLVPIADSEYIETTPTLSPDGGLLAYVSTESGGPEVYVRTYPEPDRTLRVSVDGGFEPRWSSDGRELFYKSSTGYLMSARPQDGGDLRVLSRTPLFSLPPDDIASLATLTYDVTAAGDRFLMLRTVTAADGSGRQYRAVSNLAREIEERLEAVGGG